MTRIQILQTSFLFFSVFSLYAQDSLLINLHRKKLDLGSSTFQNKTFYIARVVDARSDKETIGIVQRGVFNRNAPASFVGSLEPQLQDFFDRGLAAKQGYTPVIVKVNQLVIAEKRTPTMETATAFAELDFIVSRNDSLFLLFQISSSVKRDGMDVTGFHDENIAEALSKCMIKFAKSPWKEALYKGPIVTNEQLISNSPIKFELPDLPVFHTNTPQRGIYMSLSEFLNNKPGNSEQFMLDVKPRKGKNWEGVDRVTPYLIQFDGSQTRLKNAWGFSDGSQAYIYYNEDYFPLVQKGNTFVFDGFVPLPNNMYIVTPPTSGVAEAVVTGVVAGAVAASTAAILAGSFSKGSRQTYQLDIKTGEIKVWDVATHHAMTSTQSSVNTITKVLLYCKKEKGSTTPVTIQLNSTTDTVSVKLSGGQYQEVLWGDLSSELQVCVNGRSNPCYTFFPDATKTNYLEYLPSATHDDDIIIRPVKDSEAEFFLKKIKTTQERNQK
ncbi:hypothetical protein QNI19_33990 [Cytophagaceae bacterium DM2B3-1]|uniref:Uncharacterized protein n=1 Tax=Xanthocytophaga flava TaxID=3048013 RepID=A0ABT7CW44_9BACT|nr:hypothetical protein [Xanthocytophaga flavus]MDJ1498003.1 hypothetical protein [Xanthocytophaga flavus]